MATRLYLVASTAPSISPAFDAGWNSTTGALRRMMATTQAATTEQVTSDIGATGPAYTLSGQFVSPPLAAQTITGTTTITTRGRELASTDNVNKRARAVLVYSADGTTLRGTLNAWTATAAITELSPTTLQGQAQATNAPLTSVTCLDGDVLVVELGYGVGTSGTTPQSLMEWGGVGTDHANNNADVTGSVPWVEFSADLVWQSAGSTVPGVAAAALSFTAVAAGAREVSGTTGAALAFTAAAASVRTVAGASTAALTFTAGVSGQRNALGTLAAAFGFTAAATGVGSAGASQVFGQASTPLTFTGSASAVRTASGQLSAPLAFTAAAVGVPTVVGFAAAPLAFAASASGVRSVPGLAATPLLFAATAAGGSSTPGAVIGRPDTGVVARPGTGTIARPDTGVVVHILTVVVRLYTGTVTRP